MSAPRQPSKAALETKRQTLGGPPSGPGLVLCPRGIDNEASVLTCTDRPGSLSTGTFLI